MKRSASRSYCFHGVRLAVETDHSPLAELLDSRLASFRSTEDGREVIFEYRLVEPGREHEIARPSGFVRPVYDPPAGEILYAPAEDVLYVDYPGHVRVRCEPESGEIVISMLERELEELWLSTHPMFTLPLIETLKRRGLYSVHAAGLALNGKAVLFAGPSGSGKSTVAVRLARAGFELLGDDTVFLKRADARLRILAFPDEVDLAEETVALFPDLHFLLESPRRPGWPKRQVRPEGRLGAEVCLEADPGAVIVLGERRPDDSIITPVSRTEALLELTPNVLLTEPRSSQAHLDALADLVRESDCYRLKAGRDLEALPERLRKLLGPS